MSVPNIPSGPAINPYARIGNPQEGTFHIVYAPTSFMEAAPKILGGTSASWSVEHYERWKPLHSLVDGGWEIVRVDSKERTIVALITEDKWIRVK